MKVLIISHNALSTRQNMGKTLAALFSGFRREELCQLFIYPTLPDLDACSSQYRVTDRDVLRFYTSFRMGGGEVGAVAETEAGSGGMSAGETAFYRNRRNKTAFRMLARDWMWRLAPWYTEALRDWLRREKPTHIFVAPGTQSFLYEIALKISRDFSLPIVCYICDDVYFLQPERTLFGRVQSTYQKSRFRRLMASTSAGIGICEAIRERYGEEFGVPFTVVMTGAGRAVSETAQVSSHPSLLSYFGGIRDNRYRSLADIGRALDALNGRLGKAWELRIYSSEQDEEILSALEGIPSIRWMGYVSGEAYRDAFEGTDFLVHVEGFDARSMDTVKYSVSTKIADSLASGKPMFAYAPAQVASMRHLLQTGSAVCVTDEKNLEESLERMFTDTQLCRETAERGLRTAAQVHDREANTRRVRQVLEDPEE